MPPLQIYVLCCKTLRSGNARTGEDPERERIGMLCRWEPLRISFRGFHNMHGRTQVQGPSHPYGAREIPSMIPFGGQRISSIQSGYTITSEPMPLLPPHASASASASARGRVLCRRSTEQARQIPEAVHARPGPASHGVALRPRLPVSSHVDSGIKVLFLLTVMSMSPMEGTV